MINKLEVQTAKTLFGAIVEKNPDALLSAVTEIDIQLSPRPGKSGDFTPVDWVQAQLVSGLNDFINDTKLSLARHKITLSSGDSIVIGVDDDKPRLFLNDYHGTTEIIVGDDRLETKKIY